MTARDSKATEFPKRMITGIICPRSFYRSSSIVPFHERHTLAFRNHSQNLPGFRKDGGETLR
jgi:hypothetical protein